MPPTVARRIEQAVRNDEICDRFEAAWQAGSPPRIEDYRDAVPDDARGTLLCELLHLDLEYRVRRGDAPRREEYEARFPDDTPLIDAVFQARNAPEPNRAKRSDTDVGGAARASSVNDRQPACRTAPAELPEVPGYEVQGFLAQGGMGFVLTARHIALDRLVALKMPHTGPLGDTQACERFLREARAAASLRHPNICPIYDVGSVRDQPYLAMAYIQGTTLTHWSREHRPSARQIAELMATLAGAVGHAHDNDVIHRDIKPSNVMIDENGKPILMDFGLAKRLADDTDEHLTVTGQVMGTPAYMAPEQAAGDLERIGPAADVYSLGAVLYELLCGRPPFKGSVSEILRQIDSATVVPPCQLTSGLHRDLETICLKALAKEPAARYASAHALADDLKRFAAGEAITAKREGWWPKLRRTVRRHRAAALALVVVVAATLAAFHFTRQALRQKRIATLTTSIASALEREPWTTVHVRRLNDLVADLRGLDAAEADAAQSRVDERLVQVIRQSMAHAALPDEEFVRIEDLIALASARRPEVGESLRRELDDRRRSWFTTFDLAAPFANVGSVFGANGPIAVDGDRLVAMPAGEKSTDRVTTLVPSAGIVEMEAVVPENAWTTAARFGLILERDEDRGDQFLVEKLDAAAAPGSADGDSPWLPPLSPRRRRMVLSTKGIVLRSQEVELASGPVRLVARREGDQLWFQVGDHPPLSFLEILPLRGKRSGKFGVLWPPGMPIERLRASHKKLPTIPSPLEHGDTLYAQGDVFEARDQYRRQSEIATAVDVRHAAQVKQALCLIQLQRLDEAAELLEAVAGQPGETWPVVAAAHLWQLRLREHRWDEADTIFDSLRPRYSFEQLAVMLPEHDRRLMLQEYVQYSRPQQYFFFRPEMVRRSERLVTIERAITGQASWGTRFHLVRACRAAGEEARAESLLAEMLNDRPISLAPAGRRELVEEYGWVLRHRNSPEAALVNVDRLLVRRDGTLDPNYLPLLLERARCEAQLGRWEQAEATVDRYFEQQRAQDRTYRHHSAACLLRGFLRERRGDADGARVAWREGLYRAWRVERLKSPTANPEHLPEVPPFQPALFSGLEAVHFTMLASLTDELTSTECDALIRWLTFRQGQSAVSLVVGNFAATTPEAIRGIIGRLYRSPRGHEVARRLAFLEYSFQEFCRAPLFLAFAEGVKMAALADRVSPEQEEFLLAFTPTLYGSVVDGRLKLTQLAQLALAWKGTTNALGWQGVAPTLPDDLRGPLGYIIGHRLLRLKRPAEAAALFRTVAKEAPPDSSLFRLAQAELSRDAPAPE